MKLLLKDFQERYVADFVKALRKASRDVRDDPDERHAVSLASPTGSGKTVMLTAAIERLLVGDDTAAPDPEATVLWITDQPQLNEQTRRKMVETSSVLKPASLVVLDAAFDASTFAPGTVYFLNTQKLGKDKTLTQTGDRRSYSLWETIRRTVDERPGSFYVVIDEAHRGMQENARARNEANSILQKFIKGSEGEIPPVPLIVGVSATPQRFNALIAGTPRVSRVIEVPPEEVRESGLLKETILLYHPAESQASDMTMLRAAVQAWRGYGSRWAAYAATAQTAAVRPLLVVQVQDGSGTKLSATDLDGVVRAIEEEAGGPLPEDAVAHAFQEDTPLTLGGRTVRYLAPADIDRDPSALVVLFKTSLNTGWDSPRAEVMMSFRKALDATTIAQLVGRMVRTPLARRVDADEHLNTVALYLPHYDEAQVKRVVQELSEGENAAFKDHVEENPKIVPLTRAPDSEPYFAALEALPSYVIPRPRRTTEVQRLMKLARALNRDGVYDAALDEAKNGVVAVLDAEFDALRDTDTFKGLLTERGTLDVAAVRLQYGTSVTTDGERLQYRIASENVEDLFDAAGRKLGEGLHKEWWKQKLGTDLRQAQALKLRLAALVGVSGTVRAVEAWARTRVNEWLNRADFGAAIRALPETQQQVYAEVKRLAVTPEPHTLAYPVSIEGKREEPRWPRHLFVDERGEYPARFTTQWETAVLEDELRKPEVVAWLRNPDRKDWSFTVPYTFHNETRAFYPDFLVLRQTPGGLVVDVLEPHNLDNPDAPSKAKGLARLAAEHGHAFGRIEMLVVDKDVIKRLDLKDEDVREKVNTLNDGNALRLLFR